MPSKLRKPVLFFSSLLHGGGRTFVETYAESMQGVEITLCTLYDNSFTKELALRLGLSARSILDIELLLDPNTLVLSNSQACAAIGAIMYPGRHCYVTHGYANGLPYAPIWRRWLWTLQANLPGTRLIACGDSERDTIAKLTLSKKRVKLIRNGLPQKVLKYDDNSLATNRNTLPKTHLVYIGRISFQKGIDILLRALELPALRQRKITLSIIGNYQEREHKYCSEVRKLIQRSPAKVELLEPQQINKTFFQRFSALVAPSRFEGLPYTILEAAYSGIPIVLSDCRGNRDIAPDESYAYGFKSNDEFSLADALLRFLDADTEDIKHRVDLMQRRVVSEFSTSSFRDEYLKLLQ